MSKKPLVVVVDGIIGSGKTTYIEGMYSGLTKRGWNVAVVKEPVDKWQASGILQRFYADPKRWGYHFQTKAFHDRVMENIEAYRRFRNTADVFILERSPFTDTLFMELLYESGLVDDLEMQDYREWWALWYKVMPYQPDLFVYLRPDVGVCMDRLHARARDGEQGVTLEYQTQLEAKHDHFFKDEEVSISPGTDVRCIKIQTNENFRDDDSIRQRLVLEFELVLNTESFFQK